MQAAVDAFAVETLLISDALFRSRDLAERKKFVNIVDSVKENMGTVRIFSSLHISGERKTHFFHASPMNVINVAIFFIRIESAFRHCGDSALPHTGTRV